ncbi:hypothetical protein C7M84_001296 [Penaeus vannamei]|uniref:Uncharacterized protein n=1 Tax=Penaeus vannamei TaxID=6689 RepID=A0A423TU16_PENVA|nr:hypothetical protein C7M84_001296 [Penaeus vannamei]
MAILLVGVPRASSSWVQWHPPRGARHPPAWVQVLSISWSRASSRGCQCEPSIWASGILLRGARWRSSSGWHPPSVVLLAISSWVMVHPPRGSSAILLLGASCILSYVVRGIHIVRCQVASSSVARCYLLVVPGAIFLVGQVHPPRGSSARSLVGPGWHPPRGLPGAILLVECSAILSGCQWRSSLGAGGDLSSWVHVGILPRGQWHSFSGCQGGDPPLGSSAILSGAGGILLRGCQCRSISVCQVGDPPRGCQLAILPVGAAWPILLVGQWRSSSWVPVAILLVGARWRSSSWVPGGDPPLLPVAILLGARWRIPPLVHRWSSGLWVQVAFLRGGSADGAASGCQVHPPPGPVASPRCAGAIFLVVASGIPLVVPWRSILWWPVAPPRGARCILLCPGRSPRVPVTILPRDCLVAISRGASGESSLWCLVAISSRCQCILLRVPCAILLEVQVASSSGCLGGGGGDHSLLPVADPLRCVARCDPPRGSSGISSWVPAWRSSSWWPCGRSPRGACAISSWCQWRSSSGASGVSPRVVQCILLCVPGGRSPSGCCGILLSGPCGSSAVVPVAHPLSGPWWRSSYGARVRASYVVPGGDSSQTWCLVAISYSWMPGGGPSCWVPTQTILLRVLPGGDPLASVPVATSS